MTYEWHRKKAEINLRKHGIDFADAVGVFEDDNLLWQEDVDAYDETRFIALGTDYLGRILVVVFLMDEEVIRIISARKANKHERETYERRKRFQ
jgi:uncharacterized DUF497 family protein